MENDGCGGGPLCEAILLMLRREGLAGDTLFRGIEGFGASRWITIEKAEIRIYRGRAQP